MNCSECIQHIQQGDTHACLRFRTEINPDKDYCSWGIAKDTLVQCQICKRGCEKPTIVCDNGHTPILICDSCCELLGSCKVCEECNGCDFESNPSSLPKIIQKQIPVQGGYMVTQVKNPERIALTCVNCICYCKEDEACNREVGQCGKYRLMTIQS